MVEEAPICTKHFTCMDNSVLRYAKIQNFINSHKNFDNLLLRIIFEHDENHDDYYRYRGRHISPNNKMLLLFDYLFNNEIIHYYDDYLEIDYKGYCFCIREYNNGDLLYIRNNDDSKIIFSNLLYHEKSII